MEREGRAAVLPTEMKCVVCHSKGTYSLEQRPLPEVGEGEVLVKVLAAGICAGDAKCFTGAARYWGDDHTPCYVEPPMIQGHEFVGEVVALGPGTEEKYGLVVGDHAVSENIVPCWECRYCKNNRYHMCIPHHVYGWHQVTQGAFSQYMKFPKGALNYKVPKSIPAWKAAFIEPLACSIHAVELGCVQHSDTVVVAGCGPLGLGMVVSAHLKKPRLLVALDLFDWKLDVAKKCGADVVLNPTQCDVVEEVKKLTNGYGCEVYIEATGHPNSVKQGLAMLTKEGRFVQYGIFASSSNIDWSIIAVKAPGRYPEAIAILEKDEVPMEDIVTHKVPLEETVEALKLVSDSKTSLKVVVLPNNE